MAEPGLLPLPVVDACALDETRCALLRPGEPLADRDGCVHRLPRWFYRIDSWQTALETRVTEHFTLSELMTEWLKPIGMREWSQVVFRRDGDRTRHTFSIDYLLAHLDAWERASRT